MRVEKMEIKVKANQPQNQTNPPKTNSDPQLQPQSPQPQNLQQIVEEVLKKYLQNLSPQPQQNSLSDGEFVVKSRMKASIIALKVGQLLMKNKEVTMSALGYAVPILLDSIFLIRKDFARMGKLVELQNFELIEKQFSTKTVSGIKVRLVLK